MQDLRTSQLKANAIIGKNRDQDLRPLEPDLILYPSTQSLDINGGRQTSLSDFLTNTAQYSDSTFLYVYGDPTTDSATQNINPVTEIGSDSSIFGGDLIVKGTLFVSVLRKSNGDLVNFDSISYNSPPVDSIFLEYNRFT